MLYIACEHLRDFKINFYSNNTDNPPETGQDIDQAQQTRDGAQSETQESCSPLGSLVFNICFGRFFCECSS